MSSERAVDFLRRSHGATAPQIEPAGWPFSAVRW
jgi:hypothetical protein